MGSGLESVLPTDPGGWDGDRARLREVTKGQGLAPVVHFKLPSQRDAM
jgi:hypothetical protein